MLWVFFFLISCVNKLFQLIVTSDFRLWRPGPENDPYLDMKYLRGFVPLQDLIDDAIIKLQMHSQTMQKPLPKYKVNLQQIPYPCFNDDK